ncbi:MAG: methyltransferase domain-containing protein [Oscillospiraceae bacterium]|nr:methyltransferase domain-containing protein [Oscillospiraceae bacterium]
MDFWSKFAEFYDIAERLNDKVYRKMCEITTELTPFGARVLDCAAGTGELSIAAARKAESVLCTDYSEKMLDVARKKTCKGFFDNISFERRNIFSLDDPYETYDVVIAGNVLHLLDNPVSAVKELCRVTKRGGKILLPTFMTQNKSDIARLMLKVYGKLGFAPSTEYTPKSYVEMLKSCNLGKVKFRTIKGWIPCCYAVIIKD